MRLFTSSLRNQLIAGFLAVGLVFGAGLALSASRLISVTHTLNAGASRVHLADQLSSDTYNMQASQLMTALEPSSAGDHAADVATFRRDLQTLGEHLMGGADQTAYAAIRSAFAHWQQVDGRAVALAQSGQQSASQQLMTGSGAANVATDRVAAAASALAAHVSAEDNRLAASARSSALLVTIAAAALALVLSILIVVLLSRRLVGGVRALLHSAKALAHGEVDQSIEIHGRDEVAAIARAFSEIDEYLRSAAAAAEQIAAGNFATTLEPRSDKDALGHAFLQLRDRVGGVVRAISTTSATLNSSSLEMASTTEEVGRAITEIAQSVGSVATGAEQQVRAIDEAQRMSEEVALASRTSSAAAAETAAVAAEARTSAEAGERAVSQVDEAMRGVQSSSNEVSAAIEMLGEKSSRIAGIVDTISGIAEQTNLLALNAAIEAARAGEQGRGFAVVAEEVRKLAEESSAAAGTIAAIVSEIRSETDHAVAVVAQGVRQTDEGAQTVDAAREAFRQIRENVEAMTERIEQIASSSAQIVSSAERMHESVHAVVAVAEQSSSSTEQVSAATEQTTASTQQIASSAQSLSMTADELEKLVAQFSF